ILVTALFAIEPSVWWDDRTLDGKGGRWHAGFHSTNVVELLASLGIDLHAQARDKRIPDVILRSPKSVVSAFLRAYCDCTGCASEKAGVILSTCSEEIQLTLQVALMNYGILSRHHGPNVHITGRSAQMFAHEIGFGLVRKQQKLSAYLARRTQWHSLNPTDE